MRKYSTSLIAIIIALAQLLSACGSVEQPVNMGLSDQISTTTITEPRTSPTPIPNKRAEAVLDDTFSRYLIRAAESNPLISMDELSELYTQGELFLVDLRNPLIVKREGYIPGAVSIPLRELGRKTSVLPDFTVPIITYCDDPIQCVIAQVGLGAYGWEIKILEGGFTRWVEKGGVLEQGQIPVPEVDPLKPAFPCCGIFSPSVDSQDALKFNIDAPDASLIAAINRMFDKIPANNGKVTTEELALELRQTNDLVLIDLRSSTMTASEGDIQAGEKIYIPFEKLIEYKEHWPANKEANIVVYSQDGQDSTIGMIILWIYGYRNVRSLIDGYAAWSEFSAK